MADYTGIFERVEQKYLLDSLQFEALWAVLEPYMRPDEYGRSTICNIKEHKERCSEVEGYRDRYLIDRRMSFRIFPRRRF